MSVWKTEESGAVRALMSEAQDYRSYGLVDEYRRVQEALSKEVTRNITLEMELEKLKKPKPGFFSRMLEKILSIFKFRAKQNLLPSAHERNPR